MDYKDILSSVKKERFYPLTSISYIFAVNNHSLKNE